MVLLLRWSYYQGGPITEVVLSLRLSHYHGDPITKVIALLRWSFQDWVIFCLYLPTTKFVLCKYVFQLMCVLLNLSASSHTQQEVGREVEGASHKSRQAPAPGVPAPEREGCSDQIGSDSETIHGQAGEGDYEFCVFGWR